MPTRERVYRTEAVVLRRQDLGEADRLLTLYSPRYGKVRAVAKGARRPSSRKAGHLEPFTRVQLLLARGRNLDIITQAEAIDAYPRMRDELLSLGRVAYVVELLDRFTVEEGENRPLYDLLTQTLERLGDSDQPEAVLRYFEIRLLDLVGYRPELFRCLRCGNEVQPEDQMFSAKEGGVLCPACGASRKHARPISLAALKVLRHYQRNPYDIAARPVVRPEVLRELESLMEGYLTYLLEQRLNVPDYLRTVRRMTHTDLEPET